MKPMKEAVIYEGPFSIKLAGCDSTAWRWFLNGHEVMIEISDSAMEADLHELPLRVSSARKTRGESEVIRMLDWDVPNDHVILFSDTE